MDWTPGVLIETHTFEQHPFITAARMSAASFPSSMAMRFGDRLQQALQAWEQRQGEDCVMSLAVPIGGLDPLRHLPALRSSDPFRFLWDGAPGLCLAASGRCHHLDLAGPKRFELAQRFCDATLWQGRGRRTGCTGAGPIPHPAGLFVFRAAQRTAAQGQACPPCRPCCPDGN